MRRLIICLLIILLAACSNKKMQDVEVKAPEDTNNYTVEIQESQAERKTIIDLDYNDSNEIFIRYFLGGVEASSERPDSQAHNLTDHTWRSWTEGSNDNGVGEYFTFTFGYASTVDKTITGFALKNGHGNLDHYSKNNRVKSFKIYADEEYIETIPIKDSISFEQYIFEKPVVCETIRFVIDDVYQGTEFNDTCIAEIALLKKRVNDIEFYENILIWISRPNRSRQYENNSQQMISISDVDRLLLMDYLPFDIPYNDYYDNDAQTRLPRKTKIAFLDGDSSLRLSDNFPRLDGATAMYPLYSSFVRAVYPKIDIDFERKEERFSNWREYYSYIHALYKWAYYPNTELLLNGESAEMYYIYEEFGSIVQCNTTSQAFRRLIDGETDIIFCYEPSTAEISAAAEKGKRFNLTPIAHDAFVFIVNNRNSLNNITQQQIRDIYSGRVTDWKTISGVDEPVIAYQRRENSGSQTILQSIMRGDQLMRPILDGELVMRGMSEMVRMISSNYYNYNSAIGYTFLFYLTQMTGTSEVKALAVDYVTPTRQTIQNKNYPFVQTVYAITTGSESENTKNFIEWILSAQGQELVAKTGYTPVR
jgi:phosphate transport system substrate-binding protein